MRVAGRWLAVSDLAMSTELVAFIGVTFAWAEYDIAPSGGGVG